MCSIRLLNFLLSSFFFPILHLKGVWLKRTSVAPATGLELVESILSQQPRLFLHDPMFATLVSRQVCPLLLQLLRGRTDFPLLVRAMRAVATLLRDFGKQLVDQVRC